jgi:hypothetical protein
VTHATTGSTGLGAAAKGGTALGAGFTMSVDEDGGRLHFARIPLCYYRTGMRVICIAEAVVRWWKNDGLVVS